MMILVQTKRKGNFEDMLMWNLLLHILLHIHGC